MPQRVVAAQVVLRGEGQAAQVVEARTVPAGAPAAARASW